MYVYKCVYTCMYMYVYMFMYMYMHMFVRVYVWVHAYANVCIAVRRLHEYGYVGVHVCVYINLVCVCVFA